VRLRVSPGVAIVAPAGVEPGEIERRLATAGGQETE
jgi:hypothetical protein